MIDMVRQHVLLSPWCWLVRVLYLLIVSFDDAVQISGARVATLTLLVLNNLCKVLSFGKSDVMILRNVFQLLVFTLTERLVIAHYLPASWLSGWFGTTRSYWELEYHLVLVAILMKSFLLSGIAFLKVHSLSEILGMYVLMDRGSLLIIDGSWFGLLLIYRIWLLGLRYDWYDSLVRSSVISRKLVILDGDAKVEGMEDRYNFHKCQVPTCLN